MVALALALPTRAVEPDVRAVLVSLGSIDQAWPEAERAVVVEFQAQGVEIIVEPGLFGTRPSRRAEALAAVARAYKTTSALLVFREGSKGALEIVFTDANSARAIFRSLRVGPDPAEVAAVAALKTIEVHSAGLLAVDFDAPFATEPPDRRFGLAVSAAVTGSPGTEAPLWGFDLAFWAEPWSSLALELDAALVFLGGDLESGDDRASLQMAAFRVWAHWLFAPESRLRPSLGAGLGLVVPWTEGLSSTALAPQTDARVQVFLGVALGLAIPISDSVGLQFGLRCGIFLPEVTVSFGQEQVARFGLPAIDGNVGLLLWL